MLSPTSDATPDQKEVKQLQGDQNITDAQEHNREQFTSPRNEDKIQKDMFYSNQREENKKVDFDDRDIIKPEAVGQKEA